MPAIYLPDELVGHIMSYFATGARSDALVLARLTLVSKQYNRIATPLLYRHIDVSKRNSPEKLMRTLLSHRTLGRHCKVLVANRSLLTNTDLAFSRAAVESERKARQRAFRETGPSYFPNMEVLDVSQTKRPWYPGELPPWMLLMRQTPLYLHGGAVGTFHNIRRLDAELQHMPIPELYCVFRLPKVEVLNFTGGVLMSPVDLATETDENSGYITGWGFVNRNIKHLAFRGPKPPGGFQALMLVARTCPMLESLAFVGSKRYGLGANYLRQVLMIFGRMVAGPGFRRLELWDERTTRHDRWIRRQQFPNATRAIFRQTRLEVLKLDHSVLSVLRSIPGSNLRLPSSLRTLHLRSSTICRGPSRWDLLWTVHDFAVCHTRERYPHLDTVIVELQSFDRSWMAFLNSVKKVLDCSGVAIEFRRKENRAWGLSQVTGKLAAMADRLGAWT